MDSDSTKSSTENHSQENTGVRRNASWGAIISIVLILIMVTVGAFYAWGARLAEIRAAQQQVLQH